MSKVSHAASDAAFVNVQLADSQGSHSYKAHLFRSGRIRPSSVHMSLATWNVEGLTDFKIIELQLLMDQLGIGILCLQETHKTQSAYYVTDGGYLLVSSGAESENDAETAGVGFLIPRLGVVSWGSVSTHLGWPR